MSNCNIAACLRLLANSCLKFVNGFIHALQNKQDLEPDPAFASGEIEAFFEKRGWPWMYTSAKTGSGVEEAFQRLVEAILTARPRT